jgi:hypothetical protein
MFSNAFGGAVLSRCVTALQNHQHFLILLNNALLKFNQLNLTIMKRGRVCLLIVLGFFGHWLLHVT